MAYGTVDETNAALGMVLANSLDDRYFKKFWRQMFKMIYFVVGADLSNPNLNDVKK